MSTFFFLRQKKRDISRCFPRGYVMCCLCAHFSLSPHTRTQRKRVTHALSPLLRLSHFLLSIFFTSLSILHSLSFFFWFRWATAENVVGTTIAALGAPFFCIFVFYTTLCCEGCTSNAVVSACARTCAVCAFLSRIGQHCCCLPLPL
jgi:hypothetical protein